MIVELKMTSYPTPAPKDRSALDAGPRGQTAGSAEALRRLGTRP